MRHATVDSTNAFEQGSGTAMQQYMTEFGWGTIWQREGLDRPTRSLTTVSMLIALNHPHELAVHLKVALNNGWSEDVVREITIHSVPYCGFPTAIDASCGCRDCPVVVA